MQGENQDHDVVNYFSGERLFGDDFDAEAIHCWFSEEENGYAALGYLDSESDYYPYHGMNEVYGWRYIHGRFPSVLGIGSAFASEFEPVANRIDEIIVVEPAKKFWRESAFGKKLCYRSPSPSGVLEFPDDTFDLISCFGVLHHIPNVSFVFTEMVRVAKPGGLILVREPIISMGDWRRHRPGLTKNERGIPLKIMQALFSSCNCDVVSQSLIGFSPLQKMMKILGVKDYWGSRSLLKIDAFFCGVFRWNYRYHRSNVVDRFSPTIGYWVLRKKHEAKAMLA